MNPWIFMMAVMYGIIETAYFGNNWLPGSDTEMICDGITAVLFALSIRGKSESAKP